MIFFAFSSPVMVNEDGCILLPRHRITGDRPDPEKCLRPREGEEIEQVEQGVKKEEQEKPKESKEPEKKKKEEKKEESNDTAMYVGIVAGSVGGLSLLFLLLIKVLS